MGQTGSMLVEDLPTPALWADADALGSNLATMAAAWPGTRLRPHVKAHKCTSLAREQASRGHTAFTCATPAEVLGLARAGLGDDILLANQCLDPGRLEAMAHSGARVTVAVDSEATIAAAAMAGIAEVLIEVRVGFRCGCTVGQAGPLATTARRLGLGVRGVMGYEGHAMGLTQRSERERLTAGAMERLAEAHEAVGGEIVSGGGTGTWDINHWVTELQAGSYVLMDTAYSAQDQPFVQGLFISATVISVAPGYAVCDAGLKALGMDHGNPTIEGAEIIYCADEHTAFVPDTPVRVGDRITVIPAHIDPTMAKHPVLHVAQRGEVVDTWEIDLRHW